MPRRLTQLLKQFQAAIRIGGLEQSDRKKRATVSAFFDGTAELSLGVGRWFESAATAGPGSKGELANQNPRRFKNSAKAFVVSLRFSAKPFFSINRKLVSSTGSARTVTLY